MSTIYTKKVEVRWSDLDPNFHLRHSVYYDWGAYVRMSFMTENGITPSLLQQYRIGPILFREECVFKREISFHDSVELTLQITKSTHDMSRWTMKHEIWKNKDTLSAILHIDCAWLDTHKRKLAVPPDSFIEIFNTIPKSDDFVWIEGK
ncbi:MAG: thioesterase family protein [Sediminibacterium sp. Gen4]|jgi:acyl-CoA thioester hydrolase|uniref:acyl-CoA thioesterase n=1 Tax=unclassified Sediminibacterium TaxID=2635961 RepID=UPI0015BC420D|nr:MULTISPECIES: thioesterase family protein [unclassified Sediminibacterium]MBW0161651.1 thioesterase family protein [Sediminibacterium sp.]MBW0164588.1 thioesterase family protein [Sediminibacterium sp.]NWK64967.1 thioesterase family protein [Sediminibacterium sp. Gen4]